jgi:hypothetical protein
VGDPRIFRAEHNLADWLITGDSRFRGISGGVRRDSCRRILLLLRGRIAIHETVRNDQTDIQMNIISAFISSAEL